jgi:hypothetical protein
MVVNPRSLRFDDTQFLHLGGNRIEFYRKVKNSGLLINDELTWDDQVSKVCQNVLFTQAALDNVELYTFEDVSQIGDIGYSATIPLL